MSYVDEGFFHEMIDAVTIYKCITCQIIKHKERFISQHIYVSQSKQATTRIVVICTTCSNSCKHFYSLCILINTFDIIYNSHNSEYCAITR